MKKVLIITYYWPPAGGAGVQRTAKFCKYLHKFGWFPVILTVKNGNYPSLDRSHINDVRAVSKVYRATTWEPHLIYQKLLGKICHNTKLRKNSRRKGFLRKYLNLFGEYIRLNLFIPDSRIGWYQNACRLAERIIEEEKPVLVFSSAPPFTVHLIGLRLKKQV